MKIIGLMDCNNFFVSCERLFRPDLRTVPTVVLSGNDGCVVARSQEIKDMGIPMGVPYFQVKKELEKVGTTVFSSNFALYRDISQRVMTTLKAETDIMEQYSVDEAFFGIDADDENEVYKTLTHIKKTVETKVGIPVSVGAAKTKTIAKYASAAGKKTSGTFFCVGKIWQNKISNIPVETIWGIGRQTSQKMRELNMKTVSDFLQTDKARIDHLFGISGLRLHDELSEKIVYGLGLRTKKDKQKSIMSTRSFKKTTTKQSIIEDAIAYHVGYVAEELRELGVKAGWISVLAGTSRHGDWAMHAGSKDTLLLQPTNDTRELLKEAIRLFHKMYEDGIPYKKAGVTVGNFVSNTCEQLDLFTDEENKTNDSLVMDTIDSLNKRFGKEAVTIGRLKKSEILPVNKKFSPVAYTTNWSEIRVVKA